MKKVFPILLILFALSMIVQYVVNELISEHVVEYSIKTKGLYIILISLSLIMLLPIITGWMSTLMHLSGIISYFIVYFTIRHFKITER